MKLERERALDHARDLVAAAWEEFDHARDIEPPISPELLATLDLPLPEEGTDVVEALDEAAEALAETSAYISLPSLTSLTPRAAKAFSSSRGRVQLNGLQSLTDECAALLAGFAGVALDLGYPGDISTAADKALRANGRITVMDAEEAAKQNAELESLRAEIRRFQAQVPALRNKDLS